jgi:hypothetical protein
MLSVLGAAAACTVGALETKSDTTGTTFHRVPASARARLGDPFVDYVSAVPSGVRIEAVTDAAVIELDVALSHFALPGMVSSGAAFALVVDGILHSVRATEETSIIVDPVTGDMQVQPGVLPPCGSTWATHVRSAASRFGFLSHRLSR